MTFWAKVWRLAGDSSVHHNRCNFARSALACAGLFAKRPSVKEGLGRGNHVLNSFRGLPNRDFVKATHHTCSYGPRRGI